MKEITISKTCKYGGSYDVIVCGGGPAGVCAAISAAREGAKTLLLERNGELGGFWITGLLTWIADIDRKTGLVKEIVDEMKVFADGRYDLRDKPYFTADTERSKILFEKMCLDAGVEIRLYSLVTDVIKEGNKIKSVVTDSKSGAEYFDAKVVLELVMTILKSFMPIIPKRGKIPAYIKNLKEQELSRLMTDRFLHLFQKKIICLHSW